MCYGLKKGDHPEAEHKVNIDIDLDMKAKLCQRFRSDRNDCENGKHPLDSRQSRVQKRRKIQILDFDEETRLKTRF